MRISGPAVPDGPGEIRACMVVRNERLRLPAVLDHHRRLGVDRFLVVDDRSTDGTSEFLRAQPDVTVFRGEGSFREAGSGIAWINAILDAHADDGWALVIDADELFVYPGCETIGLRSLCAHLDARGARGAVALMIDMYGPGPVSQTVHAPGAPLLQAAPWFDPGPYQAVRAGAFPQLQAWGGPRARVFDFRPYQPRPPVLTKVPLVRWSRGARFLMSTHAVTPLALPPLMLGLLHFKFLSDFPERVVTAVDDRQHHGEAQEYRAYLDRLRRDPELVLRNAQSVAYRDTRQLVDLALMHTDPAYEAFLASAQAAA